MGELITSVISAFLFVMLYPQFSKIFFKDPEKLSKWNSDVFRIANIAVFIIISLTITHFLAVVIFRTIASLL